MRPDDAAVNGFGMIPNWLPGRREQSEEGARRKITSRPCACETEACCRSRLRQKVFGCRIHAPKRSLFIILFLTSVVRTISGETSK